MKELPVILILHQFNFNTLATRAYGYATKELLKEASLWCLAIIWTLSSALTEPSAKRNFCSLQ